MRLRRRRADLRALLIDWREYRLPKSNPHPPPWSAPRGWPDEVLDALKSGEAVTLSPADLLCAFNAAGLPNDRFAFGGSDWGKAFILDERDQLHEHAGA